MSTAFRRLTGGNGITAIVFDDPADITAGTTDSIALNSTAVWHIGWRGDAHPGGLAWDCHCGGPGCWINTTDAAEIHALTRDIRSMLGCCGSGR